MFLPPLFTLPLCCLIDFMPVHEKDPGFHLLCLYSQRNTKFSCALTLLTEIIPKFSSPLLLREMLKSHFQLNLTWSTSRGMEKSSLWLNYEHTVLQVKKNLFILTFWLLLGCQQNNKRYAIYKQFNMRKLTEGFLWLNILCVWFLVQ